MAAVTVTQAITADKTAPTATITADRTTVNCTNPTANLTASGGISYVWSTGEVTTAIAVTPLVNTTYSVTVTVANGCNTIATQDIIVDKTPPAIFTTMGGGAYCSGGTGVSVDLDNSELNTNYELYLDGNPTGNIVAGTGSAISFGLQTLVGIYTITATNTISGCISTMNGSTSITLNPIPSVNLTQNPATACTGISIQLDGSPSGGTVPYTHSWTGASAGLLNNTAIQSPTFTAAAGGTYTFDYKVTDVNNCSASNIINVDVTASPSAYAGANQTICHFENVIITDATASDYDFLQWTTSGDGTFVLDNIINPTYNPGINDKSSGTVILTLTASNLTCGNSVSIKTVTISPELIATVGAPTPYVIGASTKIEVGIKVTGRTLMSSLGLYLVAPDGTKVILKDNNSGCFNYGSSVDVKFTSTLTSSDTYDICTVAFPLSGTFGAEGDWANLYGKDPANGAWRVQISDCDNGSGNNPGFIDKAYIIFEDKNVNGQTEVLSYDSGNAHLPINQSSVAFDCAYTDYVVPIGLRTKCADCGAVKENGADAQVTVQGGTPIYSGYNWYDKSNPTTVIATGVTTKLCKGSFFVVVNDANGCSDTAFVEVSSPDPIKIDKIFFSNNDTLHCFGDTTSIQLNFSGGTGSLQYSINGTTKNSGQTVKGLIGGVYPLHIFDANGCSKDTTITIVAPALIQITGSSSKDISCNGAANGEIHVTATGGNLLKYKLLDAVTKAVLKENKTSPDFLGLIPGTYRVAVLDSLFGCKSDTTLSITINEPAKLILSAIDSTNITCYGAKNGTIKFTVVTGGTRPYN